MRDLTPEGSDMLANLTAVPFEWWAGAIVVAIVGGTMAALVKAKPDDDRPTDDEPAPICGAYGSDGMRCTLAPHNTDETQCQDETRSTIYGSATYWAGEVGAA